MRSRLIYCVCSLLFGFAGLILAVAALLLWAEFDNLYGGTVRNQMSIDNQTLNWWFDKWYEPPVKHSLTIHIFELENAAEWRRSPSDTRLTMREIGPFVFKVIKRKENWNFSDTDHHQVWYNERTSYQFDELLSYQSLDKTATIANAELMVIAPFVNSMVKRVQSVTRISRSLNNTASQILSIYRSNLFIERPIHRIIFGPESLFIPVPEIPDNDVEETEREDEPTTPRVESARQELGDTGTNNGSNEFAWIMSLVQDNATLRILSLYERAAMYFQKLGVDLNPFELIAAQFNHQNDNSNDPGSRRLRMNSVLSFYQNNSLERYDLWTGKNQPGRQARLMRWNNQSKLQVWSGKQCNELNGTDGRQFSPFLKRRRIYIFERKICRSMPFSFGTPQSTPQSIDIHRYNRASDFLLSPTKAPANSCFCRSLSQPQKRRSRPLIDDKSKGCNYDGILDLGTCYTGYGEGSNSSDSVNASGAVPLILSAVHFSGPFTKSIAREVRGVVPDEQLYQSVLDIEPVSGIVLHRTVKYQFNLHIAPFPVGNNRTTREVVVPLLWQDEQFTVNADHLNSIKYLFVYPFKYRELALLATGALGGGALLLATIFFCCCCCSKSKANQKERLIEEPITKGTGKYSGKVTPVDENNNGAGNNSKKAIAWNNGNFKHQQTEEEDGFELEPDDEDAYRDDDEAYDPNAMMAPTNRIMENDTRSYNNNVRQNMQQNPNQARHPGGGGNQYPLERLKRDMPARQTNVPQPNQRRPNGNNNYDNYGSPDFYQNRYPNGYDNNESYDVFGENHFANPKSGAVPPPPPPPPSFGMPDGGYNENAMPPQANNDRENLLKQIRAGTQLKRTGDPSNTNEVDTFDKQMAMTSMLIIQQLISQQHEQARWQHIQVTQDALAAQMMRQLMPYVSLSLPHNTPNYVPAFHHEQTEAMLLAPGPSWPLPQPQPIALPPIETESEYAARPHPLTDFHNHSAEESQSQENRSQTRLRRRVPDLSIEIDEYDNTTSTEAPESDSQPAKNNKTTADHSPDSINKNSSTGKAEEIRFYGPYRAYMGPKVNEKHSAGTMSALDEDDDWDSDFNDDDDNDDIDDDDNDDNAGGGRTAEQRTTNSKFHATNDSYQKHTHKHVTNSPRVDVPVMSHTLKRRT